MPDTPLIAENIAVEIGSARILNGVSGRFQRGRVTGILGPNGAGKTTLLRVLSGVLAPTAGSVTLDGEPVANFSRRRIAQRIGVMPQHTDFTLELTVREIVSMGRFCHRPIYASPQEEDADVIDAAIRATRLEPFEARAAYTLSGGERQRMFLAQLLAQEPSVVLLDEPTSHLDIKYQGEILRAVRELATEKGWTVVIVMHDLNLAYRYCDELMFLRDGSVIAAGPAADLCDPAVIRRTYDVEAAFHSFEGTPQVVLAL